MSSLGIAFLIWIGAMTVIAVDIQWDVKTLKKSLREHPEKRGDSRDIGGSR